MKSMDKIDISINMYLYTYHTHVVNYSVYVPRLLTRSSPKVSLFAYRTWIRAAEWWFRVCLPIQDHLSCNILQVNIGNTGWWFQIFFMFIPTWGNDPIWLMFFGWVETTNIGNRYQISKSTGSRLFGKKIQQSQKVTCTKTPSFSPVAP